MCWSTSASIAATAIGGVATVYAAKKEFPKVQIFTLGFFTVMELLQAASYIWIGQCGGGANTLLTYLSYLHISFQPPVITAFMLSFQSAEKQKKWTKVAMTVAFASTLLLVLKMFVPIVWTVPQEFMCRLGDTICGNDVCTYRGNWHRAWRLPLIGIVPSNLIYFIPVFLMPFFYGAWRTSVYHLTFGPLLAHLLTTDRNEALAIWCLLSIAIISIIFPRPLQKKLKP